MEKFARYLGVFGLVLFVFGFITALFLRGGSLVYAAYLQILVGFAGMVIYSLYFLKEAFQTLLRNRQAVYGVLGGLLIFLLLIGANIVAHSQWGEKKFDLTVNKIHSLSSESEKLIKSLTQKVEIVGFLAEGTRERDVLRDLVEKYTYLSKNIELKLEDPDKSPELLQEYQAADQEIVIRNTVTKKTVKLTGLTEQDLTSSIKRVFITKSQKIYFLQGHGEGDLDDEKTGKGLFVSKMLLQNEGFEVAPLNLVEKPELPADAAIIAAWGAKRPITEAEVKILEQFVERGGKLVIGQDPLLTPTNDKLSETGFEPLLTKFGIGFKPSVVLEYQVQLFRGKIINLKIPVTEYGTSPLTEGFGPQMVTEIALAQPVTQLATYKGTATRHEIFRTSPESWAETNVASVFQQKKPTPDGDTMGPLPIGQFVSFTVDPKIENKISTEAKIIVYGDSDFGAGLIQSSYNRDLFLNTFNHLGNQDNQVSIRPKAWTTSTLEIDPSQKRLVYYASIFVVPQLILLMGMAVWMMRRSRA